MSVTQAHPEADPVPDEPVVQLSAAAAQGACKTIWSRRPSLPSSGLMTR
jgi:hypothetical protein